MTKRMILSLAVSALILSSGFVSSNAMAQTDEAVTVDESGQNSGATEQAAPAKKAHKAHKKEAHKKHKKAVKKGKKHHKKEAESSEATPTN